MGRSEISPLEEIFTRKTKKTWQISDILSVMKRRPLQVPSVLWVTCWTELRLMELEMDSGAFFLWIRGVIGGFYDWKVQTLFHWSLQSPENLAKQLFSILHWAKHRSPTCRVWAPGPALPTRQPDVQISPGTIAASIQRRNATWE